MAADPVSTYGLRAFLLYCNLIRACVCIVAGYGPREAVQLDCQVSISSSTLKNAVFPLEKTIKSGIIRVRCKRGCFVMRPCVSGFGKRHIAGEDRPVGLNTRLLQGVIQVRWSQEP